MSLTQLGEDDEVFSVALWTGDTCCAVASLLLIDPALQTGLVNPLSGATAATWTYPLCRAVILICGKAHPTAPEKKCTGRIKTMKQTSPHTDINLEKKKEGLVLNR